MLSFISSNKDTFNRVAITVAYSSNLGMLGLLFAIATCDFDKTKLKKATVPNAEFEDSTNM